MSENPLDQTARTVRAIMVYLSAAQVAELLGVKTKTVLRWALEDPTMPVFRRGKVVRFERDRLEIWLRRQEPRSSRQITQKSRKEVVDAA